MCDEFEHLFNLIEQDKTLQTQTLNQVVSKDVLTHTKTNNTTNTGATP
jgi:hypothetical protein